MIAMKKAAPGKESAFRLRGQIRFIAEYCPIGSVREKDHYSCWVNAEEFLAYIEF
jgi:hypothetical protein